MASYNNTNLIKYEDTIRLHFARRRERNEIASDCSRLEFQAWKTEADLIAWLTLKNYGYALGEIPQNEVLEVTFGDPCSEEYIPCWDTISIGDILDAVHVVRFQRKLMQMMRDRIGRMHIHIYSRELLNQVIEGAFLAAGLADARIEYKRDDREFWQRTTESLSDIVLKKAPRGAEVVAIRDKIREAKKLRFTAYFPQPRFILQEERTLMSEEKKTLGMGKTINNDTRDIRPIPSNMPLPLQWEFDHIMDELDTQIFRKLEEKEGTHPDTKGKMHFQIKRISCFTFRGDDRDLQQLNEAGGFLPGITRNDPRYIAEKYLEEKFRTIDASRFVELTEQDMTEYYKKTKIGMIDNLRYLRENLRERGSIGGTPINPDKRTINPKYLKAIKDGMIMDLGNYTGAFFHGKGYLSTTKSTAIAKYFSNCWQDKEVDLVTNCYAVRCRCGFHLQSRLEGQPDKETAKAELRKLHEFNSYAEQEVAVAGAIWWEDVVGVRVIRCNKDGQFFFGPIFLQDKLMCQDNHAFSELFELLSGRSQGEAAGVVERSYQKAPFQNLTGSPTRLAVPVSDSSTFKVAALTASPEHLDFSPRILDNQSRQPMGADSAAREVTLSNRGNEEVLIKVSVSGRDFVAARKEVAAREELDTGSKLIKWEKIDKNGFEVKVPAVGSYSFGVIFNPSKEDKCEGRLEITYKAKGNLQKNLMVTLEGTGGPKPEPVIPSATILEFGPQASDTVSAPRMVALINRGATNVRVDNVFINNTFFWNEPKATFPCDVRPDTNYPISITFNPNNEADTITGVLRITYEIDPRERIDPNKQQTMAIKLAGKGVKKKDYTLEFSPPKTIDFGRLLKDTVSRPQLGTLTNKGNAPVDIDVKLVGKHPKDFKVELIGNDNPTVNAGESRRLLVTFTSEVKEQREALLEITATKAGTHKLVKIERITLTGTCVGRDQVS